MTGPYPLPASWAWVQIGDQLDLLNGMAFKPTDWAPSGLPIVRIQNLNNPNAPYNYCRPAMARERSLINNGAFLISWSGTPGTSFGAFIWERGQAVLNQHIFRCDFKTDVFAAPYLRLAINGRLDEMIDALMALCDQLEASLSATEATRRRLLESLLAEALAPVSDCELEAAQ